MKLAITAAALSALALSSVASAQIAYWQFPTTVPTGTNGTLQNYDITFPIAADIKANAGLAVITTDALTFNGSAATTLDQGSMQYFAGTTINAQPGVVAGSGLSMRGNIGNVSNGKSITMQFDTSTFSNIVMSYAERITTTGPASVTFSYSTDGASFTALSTVAPTRDGTFRLRTVDFSSIAALNNAPTAFIRMTFDGFSGTNGSGAVRVDNITIVPTPAAAALLGLGTLAAFRRRRA